MSMKINMLFAAVLAASLIGCGGDGGSNNNFGNNDNNGNECVAGDENCNDNNGNENGGNNNGGGNGAGSGNENGGGGNGGGGNNNGGGAKCADLSMSPDRIWTNPKFPPVTTAGRELVDYNVKTVGYSGKNVNIDAYKNTQLKNFLFNPYPWEGSEGEINFGDYTLDYASHDPMIDDETVLVNRVDVTIQKLVDDTSVIYIDHRKNSNLAKEIIPPNTTIFELALFRNWETPVLGEGATYKQALLGDGFKLEPLPTNNIYTDVQYSYVKRDGACVYYADVFQSGILIDGTNTNTLLVGLGISDQEAFDSKVYNLEVSKW